MTRQTETASVAVEAGLTPEGKDMLSDPHFQLIAALGLGAYLIGRFVIGPRDPNKPRKWWDMRRID